MALSKDAMASDAPKPSQEVKKSQGGADWPKPGEEGFVHPDGTPQSVAQLEANKQAAADRAAAGSTLHGAPLHAGNALTEEAYAKAEKRAADPDKVEPGAGYDDASSRKIDVPNESV